MSALAWGTEDETRSPGTHDDGADDGPAVGREASVRVSSEQAQRPAGHTHRRWWNLSSSFSLATLSFVSSLGGQRNRRSTDGGGQRAGSSGRERRAGSDALGNVLRLLEARLLLGEPVDLLHVRSRRKLVSTGPRDGEREERQGRTFLLIVGSALTDVPAPVLRLAPVAAAPPVTAAADRDRLGRDSVAGCEGRASGRRAAQRRGKHARG